MRRAVLTFLVCGTAACSGDAPAGDAIVVRDSAGVTIVENALDKLDATCSIAATPSVSIGEEDGEDAYVLYRMNGVRRLSDGRIVAVMQGSQEVRWFGADGRFLMKAGRKGSGPGEFEDPFTVFRIRGDTILVGHTQPFFFSAFDSEGKYVRRVSWQPPMINSPGNFAVLGDGRLMFGLDENQELASGGMKQRTRQFQVLDRDGNVIDTLPSMPQGRSGRVIESSNFITMPLFESYSHSTALDSIVVLGHGAQRELQIWSGAPKMQLRRLIRWTGGTQAVTQADIDRDRAFEKAQFDAMQPSTQAIFKPMYESQVHPNRPIADVMPAMNGIRLGTDGRIWIREFQPQADSSPRRWVGFTRDGRFDCRLGTPKFNEFSEFGADYLLVVEEDTLGVDRIRQYPLKKNAAP